MEALKIQKDQHFINKGDSVDKIYWLVKGNVSILTESHFIPLTEGNLIGIEDSLRGEFTYDYVTTEDSMFYVFPYENFDSYKQIFQEKAYAPVFFLAGLKTALSVLRLYENYVEAKNGFQRLCTESMQVCKSFGSKYQKVIHKPVELDSALAHHTVMIPSWQVDFLKEMAQLKPQELQPSFLKNYAMFLGGVLNLATIMENLAEKCAELRDFFEKYQSILISTDEHSIFEQIFEMAKVISNESSDKAQILGILERITTFAKNAQIYEETNLEEMLEAYENYDFSSVVVAAAEISDEEDEEEADCLDTILSYSGLPSERLEEIRTAIERYRELPDKNATDDESRKQRKQITNYFYEVYKPVFYRAVTDVDLDPIISMFLNFGFMDVSLVGEDNANDLYDLAEEIEQCENNHVYTIFTWLRSVLHGENEPSKNEFDLDYPGYLRELKKSGDLKPEEEAIWKDDLKRKTDFEIDNFFQSNNRTTYGRITTFCPILTEGDIIGTVDKMVVTASAIEVAIRNLTDIDYSLFYHDVRFSDPAHGINAEDLKEEFLPNFILMPNAGTKAMMWQETAGVKRNTRARVTMPILTKTSMEDMILEIAGRYRWEYCRKVQGARWNDVTEKSLTAEYCDYLQFYRKNHDLNPETKEKIRQELFRSKNNFREVFVKDYINWIRFESKGSMRLNKVSREILFQYIPFSKGCRAALMQNPNMQQKLERQLTLQEKEVKRFKAVYDKYKNAGGEDIEGFERTLAYYEL